jgi:hypothetical protein
MLTLFSIVTIPVPPDAWRWRGRFLGVKWLDDYYLVRIGREEVLL